MRVFPEVGLKRYSDQEAHQHLADGLEFAQTDFGGDKTSSPGNDTEKQF